MGQEIECSKFTEADAARFQQRLATETALLQTLSDAGQMSSRGPCTGCELEAWLVDSGMNPAPLNQAFLERFNDPASSPELAKFNVEFNTSPLALEGLVFSELERQLEGIVNRGGQVAESLGMKLILIGILPTIRDSQLNLANLSELNRYHALNEQILRSRQGRPVTLNISGAQPLVSVHDDVMLEAATTSFQLHWQLPASTVVAYFNAAVLASGPMVALCANSPFLFGHDLWAETRIPLFEQAIPAGGYGEAARGPMHRVGFGTGWIRKSIVEVFEENLQHFPVLLPVLLSPDPSEFAHLRLHNGTIWRWNRPLIGWDPDGLPHFRLEHRALPAGPSVVDMAANAAFFYGLVEALAAADSAVGFPFSEAKDNFYLAARHGLHANLSWGETRSSASNLIVEHLLPMARAGLQRLAVDVEDRERYLAVIEARALSGQTGAEWQRRFMAKYPGEFVAMTRQYEAQQRSNQPVHTWSR